MTLIEAEETRRETAKAEGGWARERARCAADKVYFFNKWVKTYDPRLVRRPKDPAKAEAWIGPFLPFRLWPKQVEAVHFIDRILDASEEGLIEKSRDVGATYVTAGYALHQWLFVEGFKATFGSRKEDLVDKRDNPDSIFAKLRLMLYALPPELLPDGFNSKTDDNYMRLVNRQNGATITGEGGENMGRGGRSTLYVVDEAAFVENPDAIEAAVAGNSDCVLWVSSANGMGNLFARKRHSLLRPDQVFRLHWRDDPRKTAEWALAKEASYSVPAMWASEFEIDYSASVEGICIPAKWVEACKRVLKLEPRLRQIAAEGCLGLDVGAGKAKSVAIPRFGPIVLQPQSRGQPDTTGTAHWALSIGKAYEVRKLNFDAPGVGQGVSSTLMHNPIAGLQVNAINTGLPPSLTLWPDGRTSEETFGNMKAEIWWLTRAAAQRTYEHVRWIEGHEDGREHRPSELLALPSGDKDSDSLCLQLSLVKYDRNEKGKIVIERKEALAKRGIASPDYADALVLTYVVPPPGPPIAASGSTRRN